jgi:hypothetical protein
VTWLVWAVTAGWGPLSYLEMLWLGMTAWTTYYLSDGLIDACRQRAVAQTAVERWIAAVDYWTEVYLMGLQCGWALVGLVQAVSPPASDIHVEPRRVLAALVFTAVLLGIQAVSLVFARYRRRNRRRITRALTDAVQAGVVVRPVVGGRRDYDIDASHTGAPL